MSVISVSSSSVAQSLINASKRYGVPFGTLLGVYGVETSYGANVTTSSAGAVGPFQFTAANKGTGVLYPMTNTPNAAQFSQQADAAAAYLSALAKQHGGNWNAALEAYSGGGYGQAKVNATAPTLPSDLKSAIGPALVNAGGAFNSGVPGVSGATGSAVGSVVPDVAGAISGVFNQTVKDAKYAAVLVGVLVVGVILITHGLTGATPRSAAAAVRGGTPA